MDDVIAIGTFVVTALWNVWPAFVISVTLGVLIRSLKLDGAIRRAFSRQIGLSILLAAAIGAFSPFCSCTVVPVVSGLLLSGVPLAPVMAFWIASPTMDPEIFALSVATLGWPLAITRLVATLGLSLAAGYATLLLSRSGFLGSTFLRQHTLSSPCASGETPSCSAPVPVMSTSSLTPPVAQAPTLVFASATATCSTTACTVSPVVDTNVGAGALAFASRIIEADWKQIGYDIAAQTWNLGRWLLLAFVLEALIVQYVPQDAIAAVLGDNNRFAVLLATLIGVPLYLNNISALPIVSGLLAQGMQPGAAIAFLIAGPVTTIPAMAAVWGIVRPRVFALYLAVGLLGALITGILTNVVLG